MQMVFVPGGKEAGGVRKHVFVMARGGDTTMRVFVQGV